MIDPAIIDALVASGCSADQLAAVMKADAAIEMAKVEAKKAKGRARFKRWKEAHSNGGKRSQTLAADSNALTGASVTRVEDKNSNLEIEPQKEEKKETRERAFDAFWAVYPHRVGKADASKAFARAAGRVDTETLMAALRRYVAKTDDRPWCNPSTWLNQDRWTDEPAPPVARAGPTERPMNPTLAAALRLKDQFDAVTPSEIEGHHPPPRLVAIGGRSG